MIDKGIPTAGLLAQVLIAKYLDHLPLYRQEGIFGRAGLTLPRSTLAQWVGACGVRLAPLVEAMKAQLLTRTVLHADETPVPMLKPGLGRTHRAYLWSYATSAANDLFSAYSMEQNQSYLKNLYGTPNGSGSATAPGAGYGTGAGSVLNDPNYFSAASQVPLSYQSTAAPSPF